MEEEIGGRKFWESAMVKNDEEIISKTKAPDGKFQINCLDIFTYRDDLQKNCNTIEEAKKIAEKMSKEMPKIEITIHNDKDECIESFNIVDKK